MAEFIYKDYSCKLQFGDHEYNLPLNEQTAELIEKTFGNKVALPELKGIADIDEFYNNVADAIDEVLGEGATENIMSGFKHPGTMEILSVVNYILTEWRAQYAVIVDDMKKNADFPNREIRRATNKGGRR